MDNEIIMDAKAKRNYGILALLPNIAWGITLVYYLVRMSPIFPAKAMPDAISMNTVTAHNYDTLLVFGICSAIISAISLIIYIVHIAKLKTINSATKAMWVLVLAAIMPFGFLIFWYLHIKNEAVHTPIHPDMA
ncbi:MAG: hypothetical protein ACTHJ0_07130 [Flavipsychrobacter sp.]